MNTGQRILSRCICYNGRIIHCVNSHITEGYMYFKYIKFFWDMGTSYPPK